jgi:anti-sigma B factor antagonist
MRGRAAVTGDLEITADHGEEGITMRLRGHVNIDSSPTLRDRLLATLREQPAKSVMVDLTGVPYIDSSGIATLIEGLKIARNGRTTLCLRGLQGPLLHLFQVTGVLTLFETSGCGSASSAAKVS